MEIVNDALPVFRVTAPSEVVPSMNVTGPVGVPVAGDTALTVALNVTAWPATAGLGEDVRLVLVLPAFTIWFTAGDVLVRKLALPP